MKIDRLTEWLVNVPLWVPVVVFFGLAVVWAALVAGLFGEVAKFIHTH